VLVVERTEGRLFWLLLKNPVQKLLRKARVALSFPLHFFGCLIERRENVCAVILNLFEFRQEEKKESLVNLGRIPDVLLDDEVVADVALREDLNLLEERALARNALIF